jgi:hypothetical protein
MGKEALDQTYYCEVSKVMHTSSPRTFVADGVQQYMRRDIRPVTAPKLRECLYESEQTDARYR